MLAGVQAPGFRTELAVQAVADLVHVAGVEAGVQPLVALVVGDAVAAVVVHPAVVVAVEGLPHQHELRLDRVGQRPQFRQETQVQAVGHVQAQSVDVILPHPAAHHIEQIRLDRRVLQVEFDQFVAALPAFVPETVVVVGVAVKTQVEPVLVGAVPLFLLHIAESPETAAHMVEHTVQQHPDARLVQGVHHGFQVPVGAQAAVHLRVVAGVVAVGVALKQRVEQHAGSAQFPDMLHPVQHTQQPVLFRLRRIAAVDQRRAAEPQRIDLIDHCPIIPHIVFLLFSVGPAPRSHQ